MQTISQKMSKVAYKDVSEVEEEKGEAYHKKYATMAHKLPILIHTAGLAQALAFVDAKAQNTAAWKRYLDHVAKAVGYDDGKTLLKQSQDTELSDYIYLTRRVLDAAVWYKRFAESILKVDQSEQLDDVAESAEPEGETV